jgi:hypothetical protein
MQIVNRHLALLRPRQPFLDWLRGTPDPPDLSLEEIKQEGIVFLLPEFDDDHKALSYLEDCFGDLFEMELAAWYQDERLWPKGRDLQMFRAWFDIEIHSIVIDLLNDRIEKEEYE